MPWDVRFKTPFNCLISGPSQSGKTTLTKNLLYYGPQMFTTPPRKIFLIYKFIQDIYHEMLDNNIIHEMIDINETDVNYEYLNELVKEYKNDGGSLIVFDDTMTDISNDFEQIFTNLSHHNNCSIIFLTQNLFYKEKAFRTMSLNCHYFFLMKNDRDKQQLAILAKQFCPTNTMYVIKSYEDATKNPYDYLLIDFSPSSPSTLRLRTNIFPIQFPYTIYLEK